MTEKQKIIAGLKETLYGNPWYGKAVMDLLLSLNGERAFKTAPGVSHRMIDILYHMLSWTNFTVDWVKQAPMTIAPEATDLDWRKINLGTDTWQAGLNEFESANKLLIGQLENKPDNFLNDIVQFRSYDFRELLNGLAQHHIYHAGQLVVLNQMFA